MLKLLTTLFFMTSSGLYAQNTYNIWYFGAYAGLDFNRSPVKSFVDSGFSTFESSTSICDSSGNILFYTNGNYIINRQGDTMKNGKMKKRTSFHPELPLGARMVNIFHALRSHL